VMTEIELRHRRYRETMSGFVFVLGVTAAILRPEARWSLLWVASLLPILSLLDRLLDRRQRP
jgi:hypothetical protein